MQPTLHCACFDHARETYGDRETRVDVVDINGEMLRDSQTYHNSAHAFFCFPRAGGVKPLQRHRSHSWKQTLKNCPLKRPLTTHMISTLSHMGSGTLPRLRMYYARHIRGHVCLPRIQQSHKACARVIRASLYSAPDHF